MARETRETKGVEKIESAIGREKGVNSRAKDQTRVRGRMCCALHVSVPPITGCGGDRRNLLLIILQKGFTEERNG